MSEKRTGETQRRRRTERFASARAQTEREANRTWQITPGYERPVPPPQGAQGFGQQQGYPQQNYQQPAYPQQSFQQLPGAYPNQQPWQQGTRYPTPVYQPVQPAGKDDGPDPRDGERKRKRRRGLLTAMLIVAIAAAVGVGGYTGWQLWKEHEHRQLVAETVTPYNDRYCENVFVDGIALGGMTQEEAWQAVGSNAASLHTGWSVTLTWQGQVLREISAADLNMTVDVESTLREAWLAGHSGTEEERYEAMTALREEPLRLFTTAPDTDTERLDSILYSLAAEMRREPQDAELLSFNAQLTNPFSFREEVIGLVLDTDSLKKQLYEMVSSSRSGTVELQPREISPNVTVAELKEKYASLRGTATTPISSRSTDNRNNNIKRAFELISGTVIQPGKEFSFNKIVGERTVANGFFEADEYVYNAVQTGYGGGVCQASSTIYLAAVRAGLEIVKRTPHSMAVNYTQYGKDATVYWYSNHKIDLVFRNNTSQPIFIKAAVQSDSKNKSKMVCNVYIYGQGLGGVTYDIVTEETVLEPPTEPEIRRDRKGEYVTYTDQQKVVQEAAKGAEVKSWRVTFRGGVEVEREFLFKDTYDAKRQIIYQGVKERN